MPESENSVPAVAQHYMAVAQQHMDNPVMKSCFFQVALLGVPLPANGIQDLFALEFHLPHHTMYAWQSNHGSWEIGDLIKRNSNSVPQLTTDYFLNGIEFLDFEDVLDEIAHRQKTRQ